MKKIISLFIALAMILSLFSVNVIAEDTHEHDGVVFTAWSGTTSMPTEAGNYYLTVDVELEERWEAPDGEVSLCLNGHTITYNRDSKIYGAVSYGGAVVYVYSGNSLDLYDCSDDESGAIEFVGEYRDGGIKNWGTLTVNSGTISGLIGIYSDGGTLIVNGGTISGGFVGIDIGELGTVNVNGGTISGGTYGIWSLYKLNLSGDADISGASADINLEPGQYIVPYITIVGKLENTKPYTVALVNFEHVSTGGVFTNTAPENLEFNDPTKFASVEDGYIVIKNADGQLELIKNDDGESDGDPDDSDDDADADTDADADADADADDDTPSPEPNPDDGEDTNAPHAYDEDGNEIDIIVEDIDSGDEFDALEELEDVEAVAVFKITIPEGITGLLTFDIYAPGATEKSIVMIYDEWEEVENANLVVDGDRVKFTIDAELLAKYPYVAIVNAVEGEDDNPSMGIVLAVLPMLAAAAAVAISKKR